LLIGLIAGCEMKSGSAKTADSKEHASPKKSSSGKKPAKRGEPKVTTQDGKKFLDGIPYDVWYDDPLAVVANNATVASPENATGDAPPATTSDSATKPETTKPAASAPGGDWASYIAADQLQEESKRIRNQLKTLLQTQATYNSDFEVIKMDGAVVAALAGVVLEGGDGINWKPNAGYIRDYALQIFESAKGLGKPNYDATNAAHENLQSVFSGSIPAGATEPMPTRPFADVANRFYLMRRMKLAFEALKLNINTDVKLKSEQEQALHESMILTALAKIIMTDGYSSADEAEYQQFAKEMIERCMEATQAVKDQDFSKFQDAINKIDKTCGECHVQYRNG
jgi:hypothetical protein